MFKAIAMYGDGGKTKSSPPIISDSTRVVRTRITPLLNNQKSNPSDMSPSAWVEFNKGRGLQQIDDNNSPYPVFIDGNGKRITYTQPAPTNVPLTNPIIDPMKQEGFNGMLAPQIQQYKNGGKVKGYAAGGGTGFNEKFAAVNSDTQNGYNRTQNANTNKPNPYAKQLGNAAASGLSTYGNQYYANQPQTQGNGIMAAIGKSGTIGGVIAGAAAAGDAIGAPIKNKSEKFDEYGNLLDRDKASNNAKIGMTLAPHKILDTRSGLASFTGNTYANDLELAKKTELQGVNDAAIAGQAMGDQMRTNDAIQMRDAGIANYQSAVPTNRVNKIDYFAKKYKDGGEIKGAGTGKSDSIKAKVKAGSFVVPVESVGKVKALQAEIKGEPNEKEANLNQKGGEDIKVSNGEVLLDREEIAELEAHGVDVEALAPHAKNALHFSDGGPTPEKAREILKDGTIRGKKITDKQKAYFGWIIGGSK
jgi:hypothetical protein